MRTVAEEKKIYGYIVYIKAYATADNQSYETGTLSVYYGGVKKSFLGYEAYLGFENVKVWVQDGELHYAKDVMLADDNTDDAVSPMTVEEFSRREGHG